MALDRNIGPADKPLQEKSRSAAMRQLRHELRAFAAAVVYVTLWDLQHRQQGANDGKPGPQRAHEPDPPRR
jgi:hypothetical protein